jgi:hypothetical protein
VLAPLLDVLLLREHGQCLSLNRVDQSGDELAISVEALELLNEFFGLCFQRLDANAFIVVLLENLFEKCNGSEAQVVVSIFICRAILDFDVAVAMLLIALARRGHVDA